MFEEKQSSKGILQQKPAFMSQERTTPKEGPKIRDIDTKINLVDQKYEQFDLMPRSKSRDVVSPPPHAMFNTAGIY